MSKILSKDDRFLKLKEVIYRVGMEKSKIYELITKGKFPKPKKVQGTVSRWLESELLE